ncbi:uncharacterized protein LOC111700521 [Eurytemora carolleeae]|uniref:uncharacterized protein LOC111700521 n=1 Tax=Eurytemora carolleeae TaxID=1294199 RepID=UPI000C778290|nr:uncharacterized protein LOC111700521 [Eurytemora carolleeae]|eukprot:XP_023327225.1 uncharacterized protein LOC111700521 [Eurytemora affinis]
MAGFESEVKAIRLKMDSISGVYDDLNEKMHDVDKSIKNNLLFYGLNPDYTPELPSSLLPRIQDLFRFNLSISRDIPLAKVTRLSTGPEIRGCRPILVSFLHFKDREEILSKSKLLKSTNVYVSEDLSRKTREHRQELQKYMRKIKMRAPNKKCSIRYDKLFIDNQAYVYDEGEGRVVRHVPNVEGPRSDSGLGRSESVLGRRTGLSRSESVHSVNGHPDTGIKKINNFGSSDDVSESIRQVKTPEISSMPNISEEKKTGEEFEQQEEISAEKEGNEDE